MNLSQETIKELILTLLDLDSSKTSKSQSPFKIGKNYHIRTVTMAHAGTVKSICGNFIVLENASWVADTGRFNEYLRDTAKVKENETFKNDVIIGLGSIVDATEIDSAYSSVK